MRRCSAEPSPKLHSSPRKRGSSVRKRIDARNQFARGHYFRYQAQRQGLFGLQHAFFQPQVRKAKEIVERDLESGDTLSPEFEALSQRIGQVGTLAGLTVVVTVFFMTYKPFM